MGARPHPKRRSMTMAEYTPSEADVRAWCREGTGDYPDVMDEWITRFLARVRRDAAREAETERDWNWRSSRHSKIERIKANIRADRAEAEARIHRHRADDMEEQI